MLDHLRAQLVDAWRQGSTGLLDLGDAGYVRWGKWPEGLQIECSAVSGTGEPLTFLQRRALQELGFHPPQPGHPNYLRRYDQHDDVPTAAEVLTRAVQEVLAPGLVQPTAVDRGPALLLAPLGKCDPVVIRRAALIVTEQLSESEPTAVLDVYGVLTKQDLPHAIRVSAAQVPSARREDRLILVEGFTRAEDLEQQLRSAADAVAAVRALRGDGRRVLIIGPYVLDETLWLSTVVGLDVAERVAVLADTKSLRTWRRAAARLVQQASSRVSRTYGPPTCLVVSYGTDPAPTDTPLKAVHLGEAWRDSGTADELLRSALRDWCAPWEVLAQGSGGAVQKDAPMLVGGTQSGTFVDDSETFPHGGGVRPDSRALDAAVGDRVEAALALIVGNLWDLRQAAGFTEHPLHGGCWAKIDVQPATVESLADLLDRGAAVVAADADFFAAANLYVGDLFLDLFETISAAVGKVEGQLDAQLLLRLAVPLIDLLRYSHPTFMDVGQRNLGALGTVVWACHGDVELTDRIERYRQAQEHDRPRGIAALQPPEPPGGTVVVRDRASGRLGQPQEVRDAPGGARGRVADMWDAVLASWLDGSRTLPERLQQWKASYTGIVDERWYPDPFVGDLRGETVQPRLVVLGLNPGVGYPELQASQGVWAQRIRATSYSRCLNRVAIDDPAWTRLHGRDSPYWARLMHFARRWTQDELVVPAQVLNFEFYPWHSDRVQGRFTSDPALLNDYVWAPIAEIDVRDVFAFGSVWFTVCTGLGWPLLTRYGPEHEPIPGSTTPGWNVAVFAMPSGQRAVISWQGGYAGPPGAGRVDLLRPLL